MLTRRRQRSEIVSDLLEVARLSNDVSMSGSNTDRSERQSAISAESRGVLANLPRTRPQRSSPRRAAARKANATNSSVEQPRGSSTSAPPKTIAPRQGPRRASKPRSPSASRSPTGASPAQEAVPRQGFECETERTSGSVQPPGGAELMASAAEIIGELAKAGVSTGERLLKDVLSRLPLS
jgi:hypothetical protein